MAATEPEANLVLCARIKDGREAEFRQWHARWQAAILQTPGALSFDYQPPDDDNAEVVAIARFSGAAALAAWRASEANRALIDEARPLAEGGLVMQLTGRAAVAYAVQHGAVEVVITQIRPGSENAYRAFADRFQKAQATFPGYLGSFVQPPHDKETGWTTVLRFDSVEHLDAWMDSPQRAALLKESEPLILGFEAQRVDSSFPGWVPADPVTGKPPNMYKTAALVLLTLFPVVMLELRFLNPLLRPLPPALGTFCGNALSVALTTWPLMPLAIRAFRPWLFTDDQPRGRVLAYWGVLLAAYAVELAIFWRLL